MFLYMNYYILADKNKIGFFLSENGTYTNKIEESEKFKSADKAELKMNSYLKNGQDVETNIDMSGIEVKHVEILVR